MLNGLVPGPQLITRNPEMFYACIAGMLGAAVILLFVGWPVAKVMARIVAVDRSIVTSIVIVLLLVGVFALNQSIFDVQVAIIAGIIGYYMRRYGYSVPAASLAVVLGNGLEANLRSGLQLVGSDPLAFIFRPAAGPLLLIGVLVILYSLFQAGRKRVGNQPAPIPTE
jgi:putative tricarboxylic transport membrane protein